MCILRYVILMCDSSASDDLKQEVDDGSCFVRIEFSAAFSFFILPIVIRLDGIEVVHEQSNAKSFLLCSNLLSFSIYSLFK